MADKTIGELPGISYLDAGSLFVAEQSGQAVKVTGKQLTDFSNVETTAQVEQAKASAQEAKTAQEAAEAAILKGPIIQNGTWWVYNQTAGEYQDTGIKATGPQGIPGPTSSVNGISPDASGNITLTAGNVNAYSKTESDTLLQNNDPRQWGIGKSFNVLPSPYDADTITLGGIYVVKKNSPTGDWGTVLHIPYTDNRATQICMMASDNYKECWCKREKYAGTWEPWGWVNPPMIPGNEYRTTERYLGKPVYTKLLSGVMLGQDKRLDIPHGISNLQCIFDARGNLGNAIIPYYAPANQSSSTAYGMHVWTGTELVFVESTGYSYAGQTVYVQIKYIKTKN